MPPRQKALVLVDEAPDLEFWYRIPEPLVETARPGCRVTVPLRNRTVSGTLIRVIEDEEDSGYRLKEITSLQDERPFLPETLLELAQWISTYYSCRLETAVRGMIPEAVRTGAIGYRTRKAIYLIREPEEEDLAKLRKRAHRQAAILDALEPEQPLLVSQLLSEFPGAQGSIKRLEEQGWIEIRDEVQHRDPASSETFLASEALALNDEQQVALDAVVKSFDEEPPMPILLKGVTGSGKTEVYLQAIAEVIRREKNVIVLVPEISLTPQTTERFKRRFASRQNEVAILHSHLSDGERHDEWRKIVEGRARIVIGARSAIFAPIENLGLIVVDEEHENSYKQENPPRYQARDVAVVRARLEGAALLLGSATPSLESYHNTQREKYRLVELKQRADAQQMPLTRVVDMRTAGKTKQKGAPMILSEILRIAVDQRLMKGEQVILFLNRRGFSPSVLCSDCGFTAECPHCSVTLTFHEADSRMVCHLCGFQRIPLRTCPDCNSRSIIFSGYGTERVEKSLRRVFQQARIARIDTDTMKKKTLLQDTLNAFKAQKFDILIGTQMIAKGLHFPNVTLVGVLNADLGLHIQDFRAGERTFQLITQVAGRAGRGHLLGEVLVQTFSPHHPSIQFARHHDYDGYAEQELEIREQTQYPPFVHVAIITVRSEHEHRAQFSMETVHRRLIGDVPDGMSISEPMPSPLIKQADQFRFQILIKARNPRKIVAHVKQHLDQLTFPDDVIVTTDVDAYNLS